MRRKKLLTVVSVIGLLACGACFLPPPRPARIHLRGFENMVVTVTDRSGAPLVDKDEFGQSVAAAINMDARSDSFTTHFGGETTPKDAVLQVLIVRETATPEPMSPGVFDWTLTFATDITVTRATGVALGHLPSRYFRWKGSLPASSAELAWRDPKVRTWLNNIASQLALDLLHSDQANR
jgi:hypothetical protein